MIAVVLAFLFGLVAWTFAEYVLHRFAFHHRRGSWYGSKEHLDHHVKARWSLSKASFLSWTGTIAFGVLVWLPLGWVLFSRNVGIAAAIGWPVGYAIYEFLHARAHQVGPRTKYGVWLRKSHFHHHFRAPLHNQGVTSPVWDLVFGTYDDPGQVRVPRRLVLPWMIDEHGDLLPQYERDYVIVGRGRGHDDDRRRAFGNIAPSD